MAGSMGVIPTYSHLCVSRKDRRRRWTARTQGLLVDRREERSSPSCAIGWKSFMVRSCAARRRLGRSLKQGDGMGKRGRKAEGAALSRGSAVLGARAAFFFVILVGCVSLFSDMTYESARSITGPFLKVLGVSATVVGIVAGLGELIGHTPRLASGFIADRTKRYWTLVILGYFVNLIAVPLIALSGNWLVASILLAVERFGKAIRKPSGTYGLHEAMDQIGAVAGPVIVAGVLFFKADNYRLGFADWALAAYHLEATWLFEPWPWMQWQRWLLAGSTTG